MNSIANQFLSIEQLQDQYLNGQPKQTKQINDNGSSFRDILEAKSGIRTQGSELRFSKHAASRLETRDISLDDKQVERLNKGVERADGKGIKDSLMIMDQLAFIVNVPSRTVITAMDQTETNENIFTNIDGAVIV
jgi:flagellar operon protein